MSWDACESLLVDAMHKLVLIALSESVFKFSNSASCEHNETSMVSGETFLFKSLAVDQKGISNKQLSACTGTHASYVRISWNRNLVCTHFDSTDTTTVEQAKHRYVISSREARDASDVGLRVNDLL